MIHPHHGMQESKEEVEEEGNDDEEKEKEERPRREWDFHLATVIASNFGPGSSPSDQLGAIEYDPSDHLLATGGISRKIRFYNTASLTHTSASNPAFLDHTSACDYFLCTPAKISSLCWRRSGGPGPLIACGDYDGVVTEYDPERLSAVFERDEHGGRRVWSVAYSSHAPPAGASASDDGTAHIWDPRHGGSRVGVIRPDPARSPICCVEFNPFGGPLVAVGSADRRAYVYDARRLADPVTVLSGHDRTVTYVRFAAENYVVSAAADGCLRLWDVHDGSKLRTYKGHVNRKSFVGLSVWRSGGLLGCGSESNEVFVYDKRWGEPIWVRGLEPLARPGSGGCDPRFVSSVCWRQAGEQECTLVAGGSDGVLQFFVGRRKCESGLF